MRAWLMLGVCLATGAAGCSYNCYLVEITPQGTALQRRLTCWHEERSGEQVKSAAVAQTELDRLGKLYARHEPPDATGRAVFSGHFAAHTPDDVGGSGSLTQFVSPLGSVSAYVERFRGNDDLEGELAARRAKADLVADVLLGWFESEIGSQPGFPRLKKFLNEDLRQDLKNLVVYVWTADATAGPARHWSGEFPARIAQYLVEHGYITADDLPALFRAATTSDVDRLLGIARRIVLQKLGASGEEPTPAALSFLKNHAQAQASLENYLRGTDRFKEYQARWREEHRQAPHAKEPAPADVLAQWFSEAVLPPDLLEPADILKVKLTLPRAPFETNGQWDERTKQVTWSAALGKRPALPTLVSALWSEPDEAFQQAHFGRVVLRGAELAQYVVWYRSLSADEARDWDENLLAHCKPEADTAARIEHFRFHGEPAGEPSKLAGTPRDLLLKLLRPAGKASR